jgi:exodeoxyribonuclease VII large subunit
MRIYPVSEITRYLRDLLEVDGTLADIWISGEVSNLSESAAGHLYFTLKDEASQMRCVLFNRSRLPVAVQNGMAVVAHGRISIYEASGALQLYVDVIQPEGMGILHLEFERLKGKLGQEGLFEPARKRRLPSFPRRIGVVTSPDGAALRDIINIINRRYPLVELLLCPTPVQGDGAVPGIVRAFDALNRTEGIDVVILARGGGSLEDLWAFNEEAVARAIYASRVPVVSAVGHETDYTIADYVADLRAPTPSAAAELVAPDRRQVSIGLAVHVASLVAAVESQVNRGRVAVGAAVSGMERGTPSVDRERQRVDDMLRTANTAVDLALRGNRDRVGGFLTQLRSLHPQATLQRGYALVERDGDIVRSVRSVRTGDRLGVRVSDGAFAARVEQSGRKRATKAKKRETATQPTLFPDQ